MLLNSLNMNAFEWDSLRPMWAPLLWTSIWHVWVDNGGGEVHTGIKKKFFCEGDKFSLLLTSSYLKFLVAKITLKSISLTFKPKSYQTNSIQSWSSRSSKQHQRHISIPPKFWVKKSFNIQELLHHKSKHHETKPMQPSSSWSRALQRHQENNLKHPSSVDLVPKKQNKLPCFIRFELNSFRFHKF
jgi:hypothetical protein